MRAAVVLALVLGIAVGAGLGAWFAARRSGGPSTAASAATTLWTCSMHPQVLQPEPGLCPICHMALTPVGANSGSSGLEIDPVVVQTMGVRTERVRRATLRHDVRASGRLVERDPDHRDVNLRVSGWIETLHANVDGMPVRRGDPLFTLSSPELTLAIDEAISARRRARGEPAGGDSIAATMLAAARARLVQLGLSEEQIATLIEADTAPTTVTFVAPMDGHVTATTVYAGAAVMAGTRVLRIANNARLWLDARVPSRDVGRVAHDARVTATVDAWPGETFEGQIVFLHPHVDEATRTALVRAEIDNAQGRLREGQWAEVTIASQAATDALVVSREVLIDTGRRHVAFVALGSGRFELREVQAGRGGDEGLVEVKAGLAEGEEVVASGQFLLDSESRLREAVRKFQEPGASPVVPAAERPEWADGVDALVEAYLKLAEDLGREPSNEAPLDARAFVASARELVTRSHDDERVVAVLRAALPFSGADQAAQRERFKRVSDTLLDLIERVPPSDRVASALYLVSCPMAPGRWLQRAEAIQNPYYATSMKACGEVVRPLTLAQGDATKPAKGSDR